MDKQFMELVDFRSGPDRPQWAQDGLSSRTTVFLSLGDRIRLLFGYVLEVETYTATENVIGRQETRSCLHVFNPRKTMRASGAAEAAPAEKPDKPV